MKAARQATLVLCLALLGCSSSNRAASFDTKPAVQESVTKTSITDLSLDPAKFDGRLVQVRARLGLGWEGDNFLFEPSVLLNGNMPSPRPPSVWLYCKAGLEGQCGGIGPNRVLGTFVGYFHYVPDRKSRMKDVFDPGPLQLEAVGVFNVDPETK